MAIVEVENSKLYIGNIARLGHTCTGRNSVCTANVHLGRRGRRQGGRGTAGTRPAPPAAATPPRPQRQPRPGSGPERGQPIQVETLHGVYFIRDGL